MKWLPSFRAPHVSLATLTPYILFTIAAIVCMGALHLHNAGRRTLFVPVCALMIWAFLSISPETGARSPPLLASSLGIVCIGKVIALPHLLLAQESPFETLSSSGSSHFARLRDAWQIWNNPRNLDTTSMAASRKESAESRMLFAMRRACKIIVLMMIDEHIIQRFITKPIILDAQLQELGPDKEYIIRRLFCSSSDDVLSWYEVQLRLLLPLQWLWWNFLLMERYHDFLAIIFVSILHIDSTQSWPPLFGSITEAYTVKRFWGKFWHRIAALRLTELARPLSRHVCRSRAGSHFDKACIAFGIFLLSGLGHAAVAWRLGEGHESRDVIFFVANFAIITVELLAEQLWAMIRGSTHVVSDKIDSRGGSANLALRSLGYVWVYAWLVWILPRWQYPKLYDLRHARIQTEMAVFFGVPPQ